MSRKRKPYLSPVPAGDRASWLGLIQAVLKDRVSLSDLAISHGVEVKLLNRWFRDALNELSELYGLATKVKRKKVA